MEVDTNKADVPETVVVVAVDASVHSERAFNYYCVHLYRASHRVVLVHSAEYPKLQAGPWYLRSAEHQLETRDDVPEHSAADVWEQEIAKKEREMKTLEDYYNDQLKSRNIPGKTRFVYHANVGESVIHVADDENAGLVVVGARGLGTLRRTMLGSISDYILHHSRCAVLVCPPPPKGHAKSSYDDTEEERHRHHHGIFKLFHHHHHHHHHHHDKEKRHNDHNNDHKKCDGDQH